MPISLLGRLKLCKRARSDPRCVACGTQQTYVQTYRDADLIHRQLQATNAFLGIFPRYALEAVGMVGISLLGGILVIQRGSSVGVIPLLGSLALGAQRLLPALQQVYGGWAALGL